MKRDLLKLRQKLMQRFLDGAISQETYDSMAADLDRMEHEASECNSLEGTSLVPFLSEEKNPSYLASRPPVCLPEENRDAPSGETLPAQHTIPFVSSRGRTFFTAPTVRQEAPSPEIPDTVLDALEPGQPLDLHWIYPLTRDCALAWQGVGIPVRLSLNMNRYVDDESLKVLADIPNLQHLNLTSTPISDDGLRHLQSLEQLRSLVLISTQVRGEVFAELENLQALRELALTSSEFGNEGMERIGTMTHLIELRLDDTAVSDAALGALANLTELKLLNLQGSLISDDGLEAIAGLTQLLELYLGGSIFYNDLIYESPISDDGLRWLENLTELRILHLNDTQITDAGIRHLERLLELREWNLADTNVTDGCLGTLQKMTHLRNVMVDNTEITLAAIRRRFERRKIDIFTGFRTGTWDSVRDFLNPWKREN